MWLQVTLLIPAHCEALLISKVSHTVMDLQLNYDRSSILPHMFFCSVIRSLLVTRLCDGRDLFWVLPVGIKAACLMMSEAESPRYSHSFN